MNILRLILGIVIGLIVGVAATTAIQFISLLLHDIPADMTSYDAQQMKEFITTLPMSAFVMVWFSHASSALFASATATFVVPRKYWYLTAWIFGAFFLFAGVMNLVAIPHPMWFAVVDLLLYIPCALLGCWLMDVMFGKELPMFEER